MRLLYSCIFFTDERVYRLVGDRLGAVNGSGPRTVDMWSKKPLRALIHSSPSRKER